MRLEKMHMHANYQVSICYSPKVMTNVKVVLKQTDKQTNRQGKKQYTPDPIWGT